jgi:hypothetical protein
MTFLMTLKWKQYSAAIEIELLQIDTYGTGMCTWPCPLSPLLRHVLRSRAHWSRDTMATFKKDWNFGIL